MALITVNLKIVSPYGEEDVPTPVTKGSVTFTPVGHGKYGDALRTIETKIVPIVGGELRYTVPPENEVRPLELTPGVWKVLVAPNTGTAWPEMLITLEEGMEEPVNLAVLAPEVSIGAAQLAKGDPGTTIVSWEDNEDGTIKFLLSDGTYTNSGTMPHGPEGPEGPAGPQGPIGPAGPQGVEGSKGDQGVQGPVGPAGMTWRGVWNPEDDYVNDDSVYHEGSSWFAAGDPAPGEEPSTDSAHWHALAMQGAQGIQGSQGIQGPEGPQGPVGLTGPAPELVWEGTRLIIDGGEPVDLKGDPGEGGGTNLDVIGAVFKVGPTKPDAPSVDGVPVVWIDTRNFSEWEATAPIIDSDAQSVTIPEDEGVVYLLNGVETPAGVHAVEVGSESVTVTVRAQARSGFTLVGESVWTGVFIPGWTLLGEDSLTSGTWPTDRPGPGGTWYDSDTGPYTAAITAEGLNFFENFSYVRGAVKTGITASAARVSYFYDVSQRITSGIQGILVSMVTIDSPGFGGGYDYGPGVTVAAKDWDAGLGRFPEATLTPRLFVGSEPWAVPFDPVTIPSSGALVVTYQGADVSISIDGAEVATGVLAGPVNLSHHALEGKGNAFIRDYRVERA